MRYLLTGGAGFIASHLARYLLAQGDQVTTLDPKPSMVRGAFHVYGSASNPALMEALIPRHDAVFHLAAVVGFARVMPHLVQTITSTTACAETVFSLCARFKTRVLFTSTSAVYGRGNGKPASETDDALVGPSPTQSWSYAYAKAAAEALAFAYHREAALPVIVTRVFNTVGPGQSAEAGFVLPRFCRQAVDGEPLTVYAPGTQRRTFAHVQDVVEGLARLMACEEAVGELVNVGGTHTVSVQELAMMVVESAESHSPIVTGPAPYRVGYDDIESRCPNVEKAHRLTGWRPMRTLDEIIEDALADMRSTVTVAA